MRIRGWRRMKKKEKKKGKRETTNMTDYVQLGARAVVAPIPYGGSKVQTSLQ